MARLSAKKGKNGPRLPSKLDTRNEKVVNAKRQDYKGKGKARMNSDVYDYEPEKMRRGNVKMMLDDDEMQGAGLGSGEDEESSGEGPSRGEPRLIDDEGELGSEDDEEIDSDDAFGESDEDRFAGYSFSHKKGKKLPRKSTRDAPQRIEVDLNEDEDMEDNGLRYTRESEVDDEEDEEGSGADEDFYDVLDILDGKANLEESLDHTNTKNNVEDLKAGATTLARNGPNESGSDSSEEDDSEEESDDEEQDIVISGSEDEADDHALDALHNIVNGLETRAKRKVASTEDARPEAISKKRKRLRDVMDSGVENEFGGTVADGSKLSMDDLLAPLSSKKADVESLRMSLKTLASTSNKNQTLSAPLATRIQERLDREAAYEQTKQEVDKWSSTMRRIQEAEHLSFPLQAPEVVRPSNLELTSKFKPVTELESSIDRLLKQAKLRDEDLNKTEELMMKDLSVEEVAERRAELRKMRELAFRADAKAKRVAKIKSKAYRRIHKKEKAKMLAKLDAVGERTEAELEEQRLKAEVDRARERATLRHKNAGKWAKAMKDRNELDDDQRRDINEMLEKGEKLRRRIQGLNSGSEDDPDGSVDGDDDRIRDNAFEELNSLQNEEGESDPEGSKKAKSVFQMKFMKDAASRQNTILDREIDDFRREMGELNSDRESEDNHEEADLVRPQRLNGRLVFRPGPQSAGQMLPPPPPSAISETSTLRSHDSHAISPALKHLEDASPPPPVTTQSSTESSKDPPNPWLVESADSTKIARRKNELISGNNLTRIQKSDIQMQKQLKKGSEARELQSDDAHIDLDVDNVLELKASSAANSTANGGASHGISKKQKKKEAKKAKHQQIQQDQTQTPVPQDNNSDSNSEIEEQESNIRRGKKPTAFEQRELVARAFAGDNVIQQFEEAKRKEMESDAPHEVDTTLAGWGSWGGAGTKKAPPKPHLIKKVAGIDPKSRADYGKARVIISERRDNKALKYAVKDLPYPYTSKAQFEDRMSTPIGSEWNTRVGVQRETLPRVVKKMGTIINPLEKL